MHAESAVLTLRGCLVSSWTITRTAPVPGTGSAGPGGEIPIRRNGHLIQRKPGLAAGLNALSSGTVRWHRHPHSLEPFEQHLAITPGAGHSSEHQTDPDQPEGDHGVRSSSVVQCSVGWTLPHAPDCTPVCLAGAAANRNTVVLLRSPLFRSIGPETRTCACDPRRVRGQSHYEGEGGLWSTKKNRFRNREGFWGAHAPAQLGSPCGCGL